MPTQERMENSARKKIELSRARTEGMYDLMRWLVRDTDLTAETKRKLAAMLHAINLEYELLGGEVSDDILRMTFEFNGEQHQELPSETQPSL